MKTKFKCPECGELARDGLTEMKYELKGTAITVQNVPARICPNGHEFVDGYTAENVNRLVDRVLEDVTSFSKKMPRSKTTSRQVVIAA
ncbi:MAG: YgiT-type zinc finger protein [Chloroflexota bacterium]|nr:YgiT-type zinc finger protein [Chloroflexota bacterium]